MRILFICLLLCISGYLTSQNLKVIDRTTRQIIPGAVIYVVNPSMSAMTNHKGLANITLFKNRDSILIKYPTYQPVVTSYQALEKSNFIVEMTVSNLSLDEVVVSANRWEEQKIEAPNRIEIIEKKEIAFLNPQTTADVLETNGYAYIQKSQMAGGSPILRGFATNRVMIVVDGVRMNNAIFRSGNLQNVICIDANWLESSEILFGPGAVMYGSDAIGGVMDFHTLKPVFPDENETTFFSGNAFTRYSSANDEKTGHIDLNLVTRKFSSVTSITYSDYDHLRAGKYGNVYYLRPTYSDRINGKDSTVLNNDPPLQIGSAFSQVNLMQKFEFKPNENLLFNYGIYYSRSSDAGRYDRLYLDADKNGRLDYAQWYYGPQMWLMNRLGMILKNKTKFYDRLRVTAAMQNNEESRHDRRFNNILLRNQEEKVNVYSLNVDLDRTRGRTAIFYGMEALYNKVLSAANILNTVTGEKKPTNTRYPDGSTWQAYGAYINVKHHLSNRFILNVGARYSHYLIKAAFDTTFFPFPFTETRNNKGALNGGAGLVFLPGKTARLYFNISTGFRAPNIDDIGKVFESEPGTVVVPNPNLQHEYAYNFEVGAVKTIGNRIKADGAVYYTLLKNALARRNFQYNGTDSILYDGQMSRVLAIQNITASYVYGVQGGIEINFGRGLVLESKISYQKGEEQSDDSLAYYPKPHVPPLFGRTDLLYSQKKLKLNLYAVYNSGMEFKDFPLSERQDAAPYAKNAEGLPFVPAWYTLNFKIGYYFNSHFLLNGGIENITDRLYRAYSSGISAPGRNYIISLRYKL